MPELFCRQRRPTLKRHATTLRRMQIIFPSPTETNIHICQMFVTLGDKTNSRFDS
jgi:hypothetical protein